MSIFGPVFEKEYDEEKTKEYIQNRISDVEQKYGYIRSGRVSNQNNTVSLLYEDSYITIEWNATERQPRFMLKRTFIHEGDVIVFGFRIKGRSRSAIAGSLAEGNYQINKYNFF